jgi:hypothetical protein
MPNRLSKEALTTYTPGTPATVYQPAYCVTNYASVPTAGVNRVSSGSGFGAYARTAGDTYFTLVLTDPTPEIGGVQAAF